MASGEADLESLAREHLKSSNYKDAEFLRILEKLKESGYDINTKSNGKTLFHLAAKAVRRTALGLIIQIFPNINIELPDKHGNTVLLIAVNEGVVWLVKKVFSLNPNPFVKDINGQTAYDISKTKNHLVRKAFLEYVRVWLDMNPKEKETRKVLYASITPDVELNKAKTLKELALKRVVDARDKLGSAAHGHYTAKGDLELLNEKIKNLVRRGNSGSTLTNLNKERDAILVKMEAFEAIMKTKDIAIVRDNLKIAVFDYTILSITKAKNENLLAIFENSETSRKSDIARLKMFVRQATGELSRSIQTAERLANALEELSPGDSKILPGLWDSSYKSVSSASSVSPTPSSSPTPSDPSQFLHEKVRRRRRVQSEKSEMSDDDIAFNKKMLSMFPPFESETSYLYSKPKLSAVSDTFKKVDPLKGKGFALRSSPSNEVVLSDDDIGPSPFDDLEWGLPPPVVDADTRKRKPEGSSSFSADVKGPVVKRHTMRLLQACMAGNATLVQSMLKTTPILKNVRTGSGKTLAQFVTGLGHTHLVPIVSAK